MVNIFDLAVASTIIGAGATLVMDVFAYLQKRMFGIQSLNYAMVGRWLDYFFRGQFTHENISQSPGVVGEKALGWVAHYLIGICFAALLLTIWGLGWSEAPTVTPALIVGLSSVVFPFFVMQPCFGLGVAGAKTPNPTVTRIKSLMAHLVFGVGLYLSAFIVKALL